MSKDVFHFFTTMIMSTLKCKNHLLTLKIINLGLKGSNNFILCSSLAPRQKAVTYFVTSLHAQEWSFLGTPYNCARLVLDLHNHTKLLKSDIPLLHFPTAAQSSIGHRCVFFFAFSLLSFSLVGHRFSCSILWRRCYLRSLCVITLFFSGWPLRKEMVVEQLPLL